MEIGELRSNNDETHGDGRNVFSCRFADNKKKKKLTKT